MTSDALAGMDPGARALLGRQVALGQVTEVSATMEDLLRDAFCSLVGSKYAVVVAAGQPVTWLIDQCNALTGAHRELTPESQVAIKAALAACRAARQRGKWLWFPYCGGCGPDIPDLACRLARPGGGS